MMPYPPDIPSPDAAAVAILMWMPAVQGAGASAQLEDDDITDVGVQLAFRCIRELSTEGVAPDPVAVLAHARDREYVTRPQQIQNFAQLLLRLYAAASVPASFGWFVARAVEQRLRRRIWQMGIRLTQVAEHADPDELERVSRVEQAAVDALRARHQALLQPTRHQTVAAA